MTLSKETLEAPGAAAKTAAPVAAHPRADLNRLRADAVSLDVPVKVHGSRVTEVVRGVTPHTEPFEEETSTMIVFPNGGVVRMATVVSVGQMLVLTNQRTNQDAICRVVKVRAYSNTQAYVELEFTHRQVGYWGVHFPADDEEQLSAAPEAAQPAVEAAQKKPVVSSVSVKVEPLPKVPAPAARPDSAFAPIGSQEAVEPAAAQTEASAQVAHVPAPPAVRVPAPKPRVVPPPPPRVVQQRELVEEEQGQEEFASEAEAPSNNRGFGTLTGGAVRPVHSGKVADFGRRNEEDVAAPARAAAPRNNNWMWVAACVFFLVAGLAGGALYFRQHQPGAPATQLASNTALPVQQTSPAPATQASQPSADVSTTPDPAPTFADRTSRAPIQAPAASVTESQPRATNNLATREAKPAPAQTFAATNARPVVRQTSRNIETAAPSVAAAPTASASGLTDVLGSSSDGPAPPPPMERVRVGGAIAAPQLIRSVPPIYPTAARQAGISGSVVIAAHIDKDGNVASMKIVSGQSSLQAAALTALKQWKYKPATLDGDPIATDLTVTIRFQAQQ